jgi:hypothetical protein
LMRMIPTYNVFPRKTLPCSVQIFAQFEEILVLYTLAKCL